MTIIIPIFFPFDFKTFLSFNNELANAVKLLLKRGLSPVVFTYFNWFVRAALKRLLVNHFCYYILLYMLS